MQREQRNRGSRNGNASLTEAQVRVIKAMLRDTTVSYREIARIYMVSSETIRRINAGDTWAWIELDAPMNFEEAPLAVGTKTAADAQRSLDIVLKMTQDIHKAREGDRLLDELTGGKHGNED